MTDIVEDSPVNLELPQRPFEIKWCAPHWAELIFALQDRGLAAQMAPDDEVLTQKLINGESDPCWEACSRINIGAMEIFGPNKIVEEHHGCPVCAFTKIISHVTDGLIDVYGSIH
jgi:hypothetical protein